VTKIFFFDKNEKKNDKIHFSHFLQDTPQPQPVVLSEPARSAENFFIFFGYQAVIPTCGVVRKFRKIHRWVGEGGVSCSAFLFFFEKKKIQKKNNRKKIKKK
jgi:hypothetical protein